MKKFSLAVLAALVATSASAVDLESKSLDQLYQEALKEGGHLVVYAGGESLKWCNKLHPTKFNKEQ